MHVVQADQSISAPARMGLPLKRTWSQVRESRKEQSQLTTFFFGLTMTMIPRIAEIISCKKMLSVFHVFENERLLTHRAYHHIVFDPNCSFIIFVGLGNEDSHYSWISDCVTYITSVGSPGIQIPRSPTVSFTSHRRSAFKAGPHYNTHPPTPPPPPPPPPPPKLLSIIICISNLHGEGLLSSTLRLFWFRFNILFINNTKDLFAQRKRSCSILIGYLPLKKGTDPRGEGEFG